MTRLTWLLPLLFVLLVGGSLLILSLNGTALSVSETNLLSLFGFVPFIMLMPLLEQLGLTAKAEMFGLVPTLPGILLGLLIWSVGLALLGALLSCLFKTKR